MNGEWLDEMPGCRAHFMHEGASDHSPIHVSLLADKPKRKRPFKYCNIWSAHPQCKDITTLEWQRQVEGCQMYKVVKCVGPEKQGYMLKLGDDNTKYFYGVIKQRRLPASSNTIAG
ncbi:hypothetical protein H5410_047004, partial [Solanum commersonii]